MRDLRARANRQQLTADFEAYLDGFSPNVQDILDNFEFRNQISRLSKADALGLLIEKLTSPDINLSPAPVLNTDGSVRRPGLDNHGMGTIFEELVRRFNEENNEEAGEHWTPRDAVKLMAKLVFLPIADQIESGTYLVYDGACGTGGMLTVAEETLEQLAAERSKEVSSHLYGQEINAETYAICKADLLLKGEGDAALLQIPTNFRCPPEVVKCANKLIACNLLRSADKRPLIAGRDPSGAQSVIEVLPFPTDEDEACGIAQHIADHRAGELEQTAVLARVRRLLDPIAAALTALDINSQVIVRRDEFQSAAFSWLHHALRLAVHNTDERVFQAFTGTFNKMFGSTLSLAEIIAQSQADRVDLLTGWHRAVQEQIEIPDALALADAAARHHRGNLDYASFAATALIVFDGWLPDDVPNEEEPVAFSALQDDRAAWHALSAEVGRAIGVPSDPERFLQELDLRSKEPPVGPNTVPLMTIHGSKGNEFDHVYLAGLAEDVLPSFQSKKKGVRSPEFEEERRNCFCRCHTMSADSDA